MSTQNKIPKGYVKQELVIITGLICLMAGYILGMILPGNISASSKEAIPLANNSEPPSDIVTGFNPDTGKIEEYIKKTSDNPEDLQSWIVLGNLYFDANQYTNSIEAYQKALQLEPSNSNVRTDMGVMYRRSGKPEKAIDAFDYVIKNDPSHEVARFNKGLVLLIDLNKTAEAKLVWQELLRMNPRAKSPTGRPLSELIKELK